MDHDEIQRCAAQANIHNRIQSFPMVSLPKNYSEFSVILKFEFYECSCLKKYETVVGDKGAQLSGGERQRISIGKYCLWSSKTPTNLEISI